MGVRDRSDNAELAGDDRRAEKRHRREKVRKKIHQAKRLELDAIAEKEPVGHQGADQTAAQVVNHAEQRHLNDEGIGFGDRSFFFPFSRYVMLVDSGIGENEHDTKKNRKYEERFVRGDGLPVPFLLQMLRQAAQQRAEGP